MIVWKPSPPQPQSNRGQASDLNTSRTEAVIHLRRDQQASASYRKTKREREREIAKQRQRERGRGERERERARQRRKDNMTRQSNEQWSERGQEEAETSKAAMPRSHARSTVDGTVSKPNEADVQIRMFQGKQHRLSEAKTQA